MFKKKWHHTIYLFIVMFNAKFIPVIIIVKQLVSSKKSHLPRDLLLLEISLLLPHSLCGVSIHPVLSVAIETTTCRNKCIRSLSVWSVEGREPTLRLSGDKLEHDC